MEEGRSRGVLLELAALDKWDTDQALRRILQLDAAAMEVERVNFWRFELEPMAIRCEQAYERTFGNYGDGAILLGRDYPVYFAALETEPFIAVNDARNDPRTIELAREYLPVFGIGAMLDVPVWVEGRLAGVLCHEHVGSVREWSRFEREFSVSIAQIVATTLEVRERRRAEEALRRVEEQSSRLAESAATAQEQVRARDEFFSVAAHELYTPLASLQLAVDALATGRASPADLQKGLALIGRQVKRMTQLVSNLLDVSRIQAERIILSTEMVDLGELVDDIAERFGYVLTQAGCPLQIHKEGPVAGMWDRSRLDQVITNLLSNAVKFGKGGLVEIFTGRRDNRARVVVRDHGIGIPPERLPRIFERFERAVSTRSYAGLGLGLFIVRAIVEAHGGTVRAESTAGKGTSMTVELPLQIQHVEGAKVVADIL